MLLPSLPAFLCLYVFYRGVASTVEVPGTVYRISGTLEFSECASIASGRSELFERAQHASFERSPDNRRRSAQGKKFHLVPRFYMLFPALRPPLIKTQHAP